jgi:hypothetical protein
MQTIGGINIVTDGKTRVCNDAETAGETGNKERRQRLLQKALAHKWLLANGDICITHEQ